MPPAGMRPRKGGCLELTAAQVPVDLHVIGVGVLALQQLSFSERAARVRERAQLLDAAVPRKLRERA